MDFEKFEEHRKAIAKTLAAAGTITPEVAKMAMYIISDCGIVVSEWNSIKQVAALARIATGRDSADDLNVAKRMIRETFAIHDQRCLNVGDDRGYEDGEV